MKTMAITDFKSHALQVLGDVAPRKERIVVTKRGKPMAEALRMPNLRLVPLVSENMVFNLTLSP